MTHPNATTLQAYDNTRYQNSHTIDPESNPTDVIIFSDAKSALEALQNPPYQD